MIGRLELATKRTAARALSTQARRRVGVVGYGAVGQFLVNKIVSDPLCRCAASQPTHQQHSNKPTLARALEILRAKTRAVLCFSEQLELAFVHEPINKVRYSL